MALIPEFDWLKEIKIKKQVVAKRLRKF